MSEYTKFSPDIPAGPVRKLDEIVAMTPEDMAKASGLVCRAYSELLAVASSLEEPAYRTLMMECIQRPKITFLELYPSDEDRDRLFKEMVRLGFFNREDTPEHVWPRGHMSPQTYLTAPSSHNDFYNAFPGGLAVTVAYNIRMADAYTDNYRQLYGIPTNRDIPAAGLCIHEYPKVWLYQWQDDGSWLEEPRTVYDDTWHAHCIYVTAELMHRRCDPRLVMAMAAAHQLSLLDASMDGRRVVCKWLGLERVSTFIRAAAELAQVDPVQYGLLEKSAGGTSLRPLPAEQWVIHLADMNWPYIMGGAQLYTWPFLQTVARDDYGFRDTDLSAKPFNQFKNYIWSQLGQIPLYEVLVREGEQEARKLIHRLVEK